MGSGLGCEHVLDEHTSKPTGLAGLWPFPIASAPEGWGEALNWFFSLCPRIFPAFAWCLSMAAYRSGDFTKRGTQPAILQDVSKGRVKIRGERKKQAEPGISPLIWHPQSFAPPHKLREVFKVKVILIITLRHYLPSYSVWNPIWNISCICYSSRETSHIYKRVMG